MEIFITISRTGDVTGAFYTEGEARRSDIAAIVIPCTVEGTNHTEDALVKVAADKIVELSTKHAELFVYSKRLEERLIRYGEDPITFDEVAGTTAIKHGKEVTADLFEGSSPRLYSNAEDDGRDSEEDVESSVD